MKKIPWRNDDRSKLAVLKLALCLLTDHETFAKPGDRQRIIVDVEAHGRQTDRYFEVKEITSDIDRLYMECLRCSLMIKIKRNVNVIRQPKRK